MAKRKQTVQGLPRATSAATPPSMWWVVPPRRRKGPAPGTVDRYRDVDRKLYPELERIMREEHKSLTAAARQLAEAGQVAGTGTSTKESRARRLAKRYQDDLSNSR
jgi:hypothetical protein